MGKDYRKQLPSGHSQQQGGDSGVRQESPRQQEKPDVILPVINNRAVSKAHVLLYDRKEYHLNDTMAFLWLMAAMPIFIMSVIWGINEVWAWMGRRKKKPKSRY